MNFELVKVRIISFLYQAGGLVLIAALGSLISPEFRDVISSHLGSGTLGTFGLLAFDAIVKQLRNMYVLNKTPGDLGAIGSTRQVTLI